MSLCILQRHMNEFLDEFDMSPSNVNTNFIKFFNEDDYISQFNELSSLSYKYPPTLNTILSIQSLKDYYNYINIKLVNVKLILDDKYFELLNFSKSLIPKINIIQENNENYIIRQPSSSTIITNIKLKRVTVKLIFYDKHFKLLYFPKNLITKYFLIPEINIIKENTKNYIIILQTISIKLVKVKFILYDTYFEFLYFPENLIFKYFLSLKLDIIKDSNDNYTIKFIPIETYSF